MMQEPAFYMITAAFSLIGLTVVALVTLRGWRDWIALKSREIDQRREDIPPTTTSRIEVADRLHFLADSNAEITKGIIALVLETVQDQSAEQITKIDIAAVLEPFDLKNQLSSNRTQGIPNMIGLIQETASRLEKA